MTNKSYSYKGLIYNSDLRREDDEVHKFYHTVTFDLPTLKEIHLDWSSYSVPTEEQFKLWVDLGCPKRISVGPLTPKDLESLKVG